MNNGWSIAKLGDFISIKSGLSYKGSKIGYGNSILLGMGCVSYKDTFVKSGARPYDGDDIDETYCVNVGDIVLATRQQSDNLPILAMPAVIPDDFYGKKVIFGTNLYKVDNHSELSNRFIFWLLKNKHYVAYIAGVKSGTAVQMVTKKNVENYKFLCPPKEQREAIADLMWSYEELIANNNKRIKILEQMAENLYKEWFVRFRFPEHEDAVFEGGIPKGWEYSTVEDVTCILQRGISPEYSDEGELTVISQKCIRGNIMDIQESRKQVKEFKKELNLVNGDTVICSTGTGTLGRVGRVIGDYPNTTFDSHVTLARARKGVGMHYLYGVLKELQPWFMNMGIGSTNQQELYKSTIKKPRIIVPDSKVMKKYEEITEYIDSEIRNLIDKNSNLTRQRDLLLPRLMSGKLQVK